MKTSVNKVDWVVVLLYVVLLAFGWVSLCGASHEIGDTDFLSWSSRTGKQLVWIGCSFALGFTLLMTDDRHFDTFAGFLYWVMMIVLLITPFIAKDIKGSRSWISLGAVNLQPAEFAKCATALALSKLIGQYGFRLDNVKNFMKAAALVLLPMVLIVMQKETGSALVFLAFFLMFYREGMSGTLLFCAVAAVMYFVIGIKYDMVMLPGTMSSAGEFSVMILIWLFVVAMLRLFCPRPNDASKVFLGGCVTIVLPWLVSRFIVPFDIMWVILAGLMVMVIYLFWQSTTIRKSWNAYTLISLFVIGSVFFNYTTDYTLNNVLKEHQRGRVLVLLGIKDDLRGVGYNVNQAKIAIGSGGLEGKGFMNGTQTKLDYVPEQDTDFIFCTVGEEEGFVGSAGVLCLFLALILRLIWLAERQATTGARVYGYCVLSILLFHLFINVGMVIGLVPVIGIPLPFFSYGGSSLWGFTLLLFIFLRLDLNRKRL